MLPEASVTELDLSYKSRLIGLLSGNLDFHGSPSKESTHDLHAFPARFPPQLPRLFIQELTQQGEIVLDPMSGSGTTVLEAYLANRRGIGFDIDPIALHSGIVKATPLAWEQAFRAGKQVLSRAKSQLDGGDIKSQLSLRLDAKSLEFVTYWFHHQASAELLCLIREIEKVEEPRIRAFLELIFSGIIITKSGGVSLARDLAHTRPHKVTDKPLKSPFVEFEKRLKRSVASLATLPVSAQEAMFAHADAQALPLDPNSVDLIVNSPPYPATAIDYMRAHKFSLVWFGHSIENLTKLRTAYIGSEATRGVYTEPLPSYTAGIIEQVAFADRKKASGLVRYYSEMARTLREMYRVLKPGKAAIVVVGSSTIRGIDTSVHRCLEEIGLEIGFEIPHIGIRAIDRNRRMLPVRNGSKSDSQIEKRMHEEHIIGFYKPSA
jgi:DNA modification methylase